MKTQMMASLVEIDRWLCAISEYIDPSKGDAPEEYLFRCKCFNEMAIYLSWREFFGFGDSPEIVKLRQAVLSRIDSRFVALAARDPARILVFCSALSYAMRHDALSSHNKYVAQYVLSNNFAWSTEWLPCRQLDLLRAAQSAGMPLPVFPGDVVAVSSARVPPSPLQADRESFYSLTHTILFAYMLDALSGRVGNGLHESIEGGLCRAIFEDDLDLALELMACAQLTGLCRSPAQSYLMRRVLPMLIRDGCLSIALRDQAINDFLKYKPDEAFWAERIHVTQVAGMENCRMLTAMLCCR
jgi:hypothetical protein